MSSAVSEERSTGWLTTTVPTRTARAQYNLSIDASWSDPALDAAAIGWARSSWDALAPFSTGGVYINFAGLGDEADRDAVFGSERRTPPRTSRRPTTPTAYSPPPPGRP